MTTSTAGSAIVGGSVSSAALGERAKRRLRLAAGLLRGSGYRFDCPRAQFYDVVGVVVRELAPEAMARLRSDVDWLEAYELAEDSLFSSDRGLDRARRQS